MAKLQTETDTSRMHVRVRNAFRGWAQGGRSGRRHTHYKRQRFGPVSPSSSFDHGQLWITCTCGGQWSACDASGGDAVDGFTFERVTRGD